MSKPPRLEMTITSATENTLQFDMRKTSVKEIIKPPQRGCQAIIGDDYNFRKGESSLIGDEENLRKGDD